MKVYCFTGYPLSGKSTMARALARKLGVGCMSSGDLARKLGMSLEPSIGTLDLSLEHDAEITAAAVEAARRGEVLDGFPRSVAQAEALRAAKVDFKVIFVIENPIEVFERISERARREGRPEDAADVVAGRLRRSMEFKRELEGVLTAREMVVHSGGADALFREFGL